MGAGKGLHWPPARVNLNLLCEGALARMPTSVSTPAHTNTPTQTLGSSGGRAASTMAVV